MCACARTGRCERVCGYSTTRCALYTRSSLCILNSVISSNNNFRNCLMQRRVHVNSGALFSLLSVRHTCWTCWTLHLRNLEPFSSVQISLDRLLFQLESVREDTWRFLYIRSFLSVLFSFKIIELTLQWSTYMFFSETVLLWKLFCYLFTASLRVLQPASQPALATLSVKRFSSKLSQTMRIQINLQRWHWRFSNNVS